MAMDKGKPGVMIYFETGKSIRGLDYETKGRLFDAILDYAENGTLPSFDGILSAVWPFVMSGIDKDSANYADKVLKRRRAAYAKWWDEYARENGIDPGDKSAKERWIDMQMQAENANASFAMQTDAKDANASFAMQTDANACNGMQTMPTTTTTTTTATTTTTNNIYMGEKSPTHKNGVRFTPPTVEEVQAYCRERNNHVDAARFVDFYRSKGWMIGKNRMKDWKAAIHTWEKNDESSQQAKARAQPRPYSNPALDYARQLAEEERRESG